MCRSGLLLVVFLFVSYLNSNCQISVRSSSPRLRHSFPSPYDELMHCVLSNCWTQPDRKPDPLTIDRESMICFNRL
uniref:Putative secreted protein n=1 Tax=Anopheles darlingi TaxID=43151 RepID=A0A2M4D766_ANODA